MSSAKLGRLKAYPFDSQVRSVARTRVDQPERLMAWFKYLESNLKDFEAEYKSATTEIKDMFKELLYVFEVIIQRPFKGSVSNSSLTKMDLNQAFRVIPDFVKVVAKGRSTSLMLVGPGGTGKTWEVLKTLEAVGMKEGRDFTRISGYASPLGLYTSLYHNKDGLVVFDDCDSVFKDEHGLNILKAVLDTIPQRTVSWNSASHKIPATDFIFTGKVIFISNIDPVKSTNTSFQALMTRVMTLVIGASKEELIAYMQEKLPLIAADLPQAHRKELMQYLLEHQNEIEYPSLRFLVHLVNLRRDAPSRWKEMAKVMI